MMSIDRLIAYQLLFTIVEFILLIILIFIPDSNEFFSLIAFFIVVLDVIFFITYYFRYKSQKRYIFSLLDSTGIRVLTKNYEKKIYARDITDIPKVVHLLFNFNPLAIVIPKTISELKTILEICNQFKIPMLVRGGGTSGYGGSLPIRGGIIVSMTNFEKIIAVNEEELWVEVEAGITWKKIILYLEKRGLQLLSYPSSAPSSVVGGWISCGGYGIGSTRYGGVKDVTIGLTIIDAHGNISTVDDITPYIGTYGILGIIYRVRLKIMPKRELVHLLVTNSNEEKLILALEKFSFLEPYYLHFFDKKILDWKNRGNNLSETACKSGCVELVFEKDDFNEKEYQKTLFKTNLTNCSSEEAILFWKERFKTLKIKRAGPSLIISEVTIPLNKVGLFTNIIHKRFRNHNYAIDILVVSDNLAVVMFFLLTDSRDLLYFFRLIYSFEIVRMAIKNGGSSYSSGLWLSTYSSNALLCNNSLVKQLKKINDPNGIFNYGKVFGNMIPRFFPIFPYNLVVRLGIPLGIITVRLMNKLGFK